MKDISGKLVLVTGGASGIGRLMALDFARRGGRVAVWDISAPALRALEKEAAAEGLSITGMGCDISGRDAVYRRAKALVKKLGPVDILVNNAGVVSGKTLLETPDEKIEKTIQVNVLPLFWTAKAFLPSMLERNSGHIVTVASAAGLIGVRGLADYCASKFAAVGFDESLRMELRRMKSAVKTTVICPFFIDTGMFAGVKTRFPLLLPVMQPRYAVRRIVKAVLNKRKRLIIPPFAGTILLLRLFPLGFLDAVADFFGISHAMDEFKGRNGGKG
ncbi:MAG: SDR family oxidoreductase [Treponema sp.]|jgi:all-trans-retinol dehydrogenase (NAD+)|nr:SDR family oxidoreductase [Treponema sp.]